MLLTIKVVDLGDHALFDIGDVQVVCRGLKGERGGGTHYFCSQCLSDRWEHIIGHTLEQVDQ
jgi:hypothetical protein